MNKFFALLFSILCIVACGPTVTGPGSTGGEAGEAGASSFDPLQGCSLEPGLLLPTYAYPNVLHPATCPTEQHQYMFCKPETVLPAAACTISVDQRPNGNMWCCDLPGLFDAERASGEIQ